MPYKYNKLRGRIVEKFGSQEKFAETLKKVMFPYLEK